MQRRMGMGGNAPQDCTCKGDHPHVKATFVLTMLYAEWEGVWGEQASYLAVKFQQRTLIS